MKKQKKHYRVVAAFVMMKGEVLCMQRGQSKYEYTSCKWEFPGGKIEPGETPQQALIRELHEEMDYDVCPIRRLVEMEHEYPDFCISLDTWLCEASTCEFNMKEHIAYRWMKPEALDTLDFAAADKDIIEAMKSVCPAPF